MFGVTSACLSVTVSSYIQENKKIICTHCPIHVSRLGFSQFIESQTVYTPPVRECSLIMGHDISSHLSRNHKILQQSFTKDPVPGISSKLLTGSQECIFPRTVYILLWNLLYASWVHEVCGTRTVTHTSVRDIRLARTPTWDCGLSKNYGHAVTQLSSRTDFLGLEHVL